MTKSKKAILLLLLSITMVCSISSCNKAAKKETGADSTISAQIPDTLIIEEDVWIVDENKINNLPLSTEAPKTEHKKAAAKDKKSASVKDASVAKINETTASNTQSKTVSKIQIDSLLTGIGYHALDSVDVTSLAIPLEETQTVIAYNKKGVAKEAFQVVTDGNGDIEHIIFVNKKHKDVYDVQTGMTGKDVKKLRKELKHMVKNGQVFLYDDQSNIMYLMDASNKKGSEITEGDVDNMEVSAIIWKDKKHHQKN
jgi:hypothetical protein